MVVWVIVAVTGWAPVAFVLGLVIGRAIRVADHQEPGIPRPREVLAGR